MLLLIVILILVFGLGGNWYNDGAYRTHGFGIGGILLVILLVLFLTHRL